MTNGTHKVPRKFQDEDKWFVIFNKTQLLIVGVSGAFCAILFFILAKIGLTVLGLILVVVIMVLSGLLAFLPMPDNKYMYGGGYPVYIIVRRLINKMFIAKKIVYTKFESEDDL